MNICFLTVKDLLSGAGVEKYTREVGRRLVERGHSVTVYSSGGDRNVSEWNGIRIRRMPKARPYWLEKPCASFLASAAAWCDTSPDVFHFHGACPGAAALFLANKAPTVLQLHGIEWQRSRWGFFGRTIIKILEPCAFLRADYITAVSQMQCNYYAERIGRSIGFIPTAAEIKPLREPQEMIALGIVPGKYVFFASRLVQEKGLHYLLDAFRSLSHDYSLVIAGEGPANTAYVREVKALATGDPRIRFLGHVTGRLLEELFSNAAAFVQPSEVEGMAIALLEAMSYGNVCIASDIPENLEAIGETGLSFRSKDSEDLSASLQSVLDHPELYANLRAAARERVRRLYSWDRVTDQLERLYSRMSEIGMVRGSKAMKMAANRM